MDRNEAIDIVKKNWPDGNYRLCEALKTLIPELQGLYNEKIRKAILGLVIQSSEVLDKRNQNNMIAWLEEQGEPNMDDK